MTVDSTNLLVALKQKPHPSDAGSRIVCEKSEEGRARSGEGRARSLERGGKSEERRGESEEGRGL